MNITESSPQRTIKNEKNPTTFFQVANVVIISKIATTFENFQNTQPYTIDLITFIVVKLGCDTLVATPLV